MNIRLHKNPKRFTPAAKALSTASEQTLQFVSDMSARHPRTLCPTSSPPSPSRLYSLSLTCQPDIRGHYAPHHHHHHRADPLRSRRMRLGMSDCSFTQHFCLFASGGPARNVDHFSHRLFFFLCLWQRQRTFLQRGSMIQCQGHTDHFSHWLFFMSITATQNILTQRLNNPM